MFPTLTNPADLLAAVPYLLGYHPTHSLVAVMIDDRAVKGVIRYDLPEDPGDAPELAHCCAHALVDSAMPSAFLIGYGPGPLVTPVMDGIYSALTSAEVEIIDAIRCQSGRYWSYVCPNPECCSPDGVPYDVSSSTIAASAVTAGMVALPDRDALCQIIAHADGPEREPVKTATVAARARAEAQLDTTRWFTEGLRHARKCFDHVRADRPIPPDDLAWLGVLLTSILVRDIALTLISEYGDDVSMRLWKEVTRRVEPEYVLAPAVNLGFLAMRAGDGTLARLAAERALAVDPTYSFANLIMAALEYNVSPAAIAEVEFADMFEQITAQAIGSPQKARPVLP
ncbi:DUF4192 domain-containing protein [Nonomuraea sp. NPDC050556]|uniref:DUF4192 domain-containing protein n=1 Tax=Nonomuraea sp. NPDC050556 TaxID=3364369 RepID=UPI0037913A46